jgi:hypothetical protein
MGNLLLVLLKTTELTQGAKQQQPRLKTERDPDMRVDLGLGE